MENIHTPQRLENESQIDYKIRRERSKEANKLLRNPQYKPNPLMANPLIQFANPLLFKLLQRV